MLGLAPLARGVYIYLQRYVYIRRGTGIWCIGGDGMTKKDWTLLVVAAARSPLQPVQLQKVLFLIGEELSSTQRKTRSFYKFEPYDYGPFCSEVYADADLLAEDGFLQIGRPPGQSYRVYGITSVGMERADELREDLDDSVRHYLDKIVLWVSGLNFRQLVSWIYHKYPRMRENSIFQD